MTTPSSLSLICFLVGPATFVAAQSFENDVQSLLSKYCVECHSGDDPRGDVNFASITNDAEVNDAFEVWAKVDELLSQKQMPPDDEPQPTDTEVALLRGWYQTTFVESVKAKPSVFRPRRLSATEYRNTMRSLFGFDLEVNIMEAEQTVSETSLVMKLLPTDPPGKSRFRNDTHGNPLSTQIWEQYSYLVDSAIEELFSPRRRDRLAVMTGEIVERDFSDANAISLLRNFVPRAYRRNIESKELEQIVNRLDGATDPVAAAKREMKQILMSPAFMYRGLRMPTKPGQQNVDNFELAERLSYFIWSDMPDATLSQLASQGKLVQPETFHEQINRMLDSPKAQNLATDFAVQWLLLDEIDHVSNNPPMMVALKSQPVDFFAYLIAEDRPLMELVDSKTTFANPLTRKFYLPDIKQMGKYRRPKGIEIEIVPNQKLFLRATAGRGGLLTMPGVLAMNRGPILRGVWLLERILGEHLPDPPADVGQVEASIPGAETTFRERFAKHRENKSCAICHDKIDPLGFALEGYDDKGHFLPAKKNETGKHESNNNVDTSGQLPSGEQFKDFDELKQILLAGQRERIVRNIVQQMLAYALCRKLEIYDQPTVEGIVETLVSSDGTWRDLVFEIANSLPFRETVVNEPQPSNGDVP